MTILFCDVTGSTALGERLDSESLRRVMERYFTLAREVLAAGRVGTSRLVLTAVERLDDNVDKLVVFARAVLGGVAELREAAFCFSGLA